MRRRLATLVGAAGAAVLLVGGCSSSDSRPSRQAMIDQAVEEAEIDEETATCLVDGLLDEFGAERVEEMVTSNEDPEDLSEDEQAALTEVGLACFDTEDFQEPGPTIEDAPATTVG